MKNGVELTRTYNNANQLITEVGGGITRTYTYDANGNSLGLTSSDGTSVIQGYDSLNRMVSWSDGIETETTVFRGAEWHRASTTADGVTTTYSYDGDNVVMDFFEGTNNGQGNANGKGKSQGQCNGNGIALTRFYVTPFFDQNLSMTDSTTGKTHFYTHDGLQKEVVLVIL